MFLVFQGILSKVNAYMHDTIFSKHVIGLIAKVLSLGKNFGEKTIQYFTCAPSKFVYVEFRYFVQRSTKKDKNISLK